MSKKEQYGLEFIRMSVNGISGCNCLRINGIVDQNNSLQFLSFLNLEDAQRLIAEIDSHLNGVQIGLNIQFFEHIELEFIGAHLKIDQRPYTFPLIDIRNLLLEWIEFLQS